MDNESIPYIPPKRPDDDARRFILELRIMESSTLQDIALELRRAADEVDGLPWEALRPGTSMVLRTPAGVAIGGFNILGRQGV